MSRRAHIRGGAVVLVAALCAGAGLARTAVAQQIPVRVGGSTSSFVGVPFDVPLEVDMSARSDKLGSFALTLSWNPAVLRFVSGQNGTFGDLRGGDSATAVDSGIVRLAGANPVGVGGHVVLGVARFIPLTTASDTFKLNVIELYAAGTFADLLPSAVWSNRLYCNAVGRYGDVNGDSTVNSADALAVLTYASGASVPGVFSAALGDVDGDGVAGSRDALLMLAAGIGLDVSAFRVYLTAPGACAVPQRPLLALTPGGVTLDLGQQVRYTAIATDSSGAGVAVSGLVWSSSNPSVATVDSLGHVSAVAAGSTTVTVLRPTGTSASAVVTVLARHTHWVDALANPDPDNELGAPELPFATIPQALAYARAGDTVMVRPGRYEDTLVITQPVVLMGDTSGGASRPLISAHSLYDFGVVVQAAGRVELQALRIDTLTQGVDVLRADTLVVRGVELRAPASSYYTSLNVDTAGAVFVQRSTFFGAGTGSYAYNAAITVNATGLLVIDSTTIAEFGDDGVDLYGVDSVLVRGSTIQHNYGYGVYGTGTAWAAAFRGNLLAHNGYGQVSVDGFRAARFDHNRIVSDVSDGLDLYGVDTTAVVSLLGDSIATLSYGDPLYVSPFDSLTLDSAVIRAPGGYSSSLSGGGFVGVHHSRFLDITGDALDIYPGTFDSTHVVLRNVAFSGPAKGICDQCAAMLYGSNLSVDADTVAMTNMSYGFDLSDSRVVLRHATLDDYYKGVYSDGGYLSIANSSFNHGYYGTEWYGYGAADSVLVTGSTFASHSSYAVYSALNTGATVVSGSHFTNDNEAIYHYCGQLRVANDTATGGSYGVAAYGCGAGDTLGIDASSFSGFDSYGAYLSGGAAHLVTNSSFPDDYTGVYSYAAVHSLVSHNTLAVSGSGQEWQGIYVAPDTDAVIVANAVSGQWLYGSLVASSARAVAFDSNTVSGGVGAALWAQSQVDSLHMRDNTITNLSYGYGYFAPSAAIRLDGGTLSGLNYMAEIRRNHVIGTTNGMVLNRSASDTLTIQVDSNTVRDADSVGVLITNYSYAHLRYNAIDSSGLDGVRITNSSLARAAVLADSNNVTRSQHFGVNNLTTYIVDATLNWWGNASGPTCDTCAALGDSVSLNVTYAPFLAAPVSTYAPAPPLLAALRSAPTLLTSAPAAAASPAPTARSTWQAPTAPAPRARRHTVTERAAGSTIPAAPPLTTANRVSVRLAAQAAVRAAQLRRREAERAQALQRLEARRAAQEQRHAERLQAQAAKRQQQPGAPPPRRFQ